MYQRMARELSQWANNSDTSIPQTTATITGTPTGRFIETSSGRTNQFSRYYGPPVAEPMRHAAVHRRGSADEIRRGIYLYRVYFYNSRTDRDPACMSNENMQYEDADHAAELWIARGVLSVATSRFA
jgi:hypothetical protein